MVAPRRRLDRGLVARERGISRGTTRARLSCMDMRYVALMLAVVLLAGCEKDPYMARKGGYMPGETYHHQSGLYPGMTVSRVDS